MAAALKAVVAVYARGGWLTAQERKDLEEQLKDAASFDAEKLGNAIKRLHESGYWDTLPPVEGMEEEDMRGGNGRVEIEEVRKDGWMMTSPHWWRGECWGPSVATPVFLILPPKVAKLGRKGASFSCMELVRKRGIWRPQGACDMDSPFANVYPP